MIKRTDAQITESLINTQPTLSYSAFPAWTGKGGVFRVFFPFFVQTMNSDFLSVCLSHHQCVFVCTSMWLYVPVCLTFVYSRLANCQWDLPHFPEFPLTAMWMKTPESHIQVMTNYNTVKVMSLCECGSMNQGLEMCLNHGYLCGQWA